MKSIKFFAVASAVALLSTTGFTSCNQKNAPDGPGTYNGETVKTEFSIAIPDLSGSNKAPGRLYMPGTTVQRDANEFQGITGITLVPFATQGEIQETDSRIGDNINLAPVVKADISEKNSKAKVYSDVKIPLTTASFLCYGKSLKSGSLFETGSLTDHNLSSSDLSEFSFDLESIQPNASAITAGGTSGGNLLAYLTSVASADDGQTTPKKWYQYTNADDAGMTAMFQTFAGISGDPNASDYRGMHGLSSFEVARVLSDLYTSLIPVTSPIATAVKAAINNDTYAVVAVSGTPAVATVTLGGALNDFPHDSNLPDGSIDIKWNSSSHKFEVGSYENMATPDKYVYPAQLWYYVNSQIKTSNSSKKTLYESTTNSWNDILNAHTDAISVNSRTRAVAIEDKIQYAVGRLDVTVKVTGDNSKLADNSQAVTGVATDVVVPGDGFPVTAVLIGGQKQVGWNFAPKGSTEYTIYDNIMTSSVEETPAVMVAKNGVASTVNSTLVLETAASTDVMLAVEMINNSGKDFYGVGGQLIPNNGKFYVCAKLEASPATETGNKVFAQDYKTVANLNLISLKSAYNTIPDLRTPRLELGFSVDLTWQDGHVYDNIIINE